METFICYDYDIAPLSGCFYRTQVFLRMRKNFVAPKVYFTTAQ